MAKKTNPKPHAQAAKPKKDGKPAAKATPPEAATLAAAAQPPAASAAPTQTKQAAQAATPKKLSALDAAAKVLAESGEAMTTQALIQAMAAKGYWTSPGGKTPHATLYAAILREITAKGKDARFKKSARGKFALAG
jgi:vancomycin resistance protein YoaR